MIKLLVILIAACATAELFWWIVGGLLLATAVWYAVRTYRIAAAETAAEALTAHQDAHAIAARADQQHAWTLAGDARGTYGQRTSSHHS